MRSDLQKEFSANGRRAYREASREFYQRRRKRRPSEWARQERFFAPGQSPVARGIKIRYRADLMPHADEPMDAADDPTVNKIVLWLPIRDGKTLAICANVIGRTVTDDPGNIYSVHPTDDDVHKFSTDDIEPMIQACLKGYFVEKKSRETGRTVDHKRFAGGSLRIVSAGSITKFRGTSVKILLLHELDALVVESIYKALGRTKGFDDAVIIMESTGTLSATVDDKGKTVYRSRIHENYDQGDKRKWFCECVNCGALQWLKFEQIKFPTSRMDLARYHCEACDFPHTEDEWRTMAREGRWFPTAGLTEEEQRDISANWRKAKAVNPLVRSYWRNGFNSMLPTSKGYATKLHEFVAEGEAAKSSREALKTWTNEIKAELWNPDDETEAPPDWRTIFDRREKYTLVPAKASFLTAFADCQLNRIEVGWRAWGRNEETWGMDYVVLDGAIRHPEVWQKLARELARTFAREDGAKMNLGFAFVDGGHYAEDVYRWFQMLAGFMDANHPLHAEAIRFFAGSGNNVAQIYGKVRASKGIGQDGHPIIDKKLMTVARTLKGHHIGTWEAKDRIYERLRMGLPSEPVKGIMHYNESYPEGFFQGLVKEKVTVVVEKGGEVRKYTDKVTGNEPLDIEVGSLAAYLLRHRNFDELERELAEQVKPTKEEPEPELAHSGANWVTGGARW